MSTPITSYNRRMAVLAPVGYTTTLLVPGTHRNRYQVDAIRSSVPGLSVWPSISDTGGSAN